MSKHAGSLWDADTGELITRLHGSGDLFRRPVFSPDGTLLATQTGDGAEVRVWDTNSGAARATGFGPGVGTLAGRMVITTAFSADNRQLMTVYDFGELRVWDVASGQLLIEPPAQVFSRMVLVLDAAFSPDPDAGDAAERQRALVQVRLPDLCVHEGARRGGRRACVDFGQAQRPRALTPVAPPVRS